MFSRPSYTFNEDDVIGIIEVVVSGPVREDAEVIILGGTYIQLMLAPYQLAVGMRLFIL